MSCCLPSTLHKLRTNNRRTKCGLFAHHEDYLVSRMSYTNIEELSKVIDLERSGKGHTEAKKVVICKKCFGHVETEIAIHKVHE